MGDFNKKYSMKWPRCKNLRCLAHQSREKVEHMCRMREDCTGFSFSANELVGRGCLKNCFHKEYNGYGYNLYDFWEKKHFPTPKIAASNHFPELFTRCAKETQNSYSWKGHANPLKKTAPFMHHLGQKDNAIAGVSVPHGWCVRLFENPNFLGGSLLIAGGTNVNCLRRYRLKGDRSWMHKTSSVKVWKDKVCQGDRPRKEIRAMQRAMAESKQAAANKSAKKATPSKHMLSSFASVASMLGELDGTEKTTKKVKTKAKAAAKAAKKAVKKAMSAAGKKAYAKAVHKAAKAKKVAKKAKKAVKHAKKAAKKKVKKSSSLAKKLRAAVKVGQSQERWDVTHAHPKLQHAVKTVSKIAAQNAKHLLKKKKQTKKAVKKAKKAKKEGEGEGEEGEEGCQE